MKTRLSFSKPDVTIDQNEQTVTATGVCWVDLNKLLNKNFVSWMLTQERILKFVEKYEYDNKKNVVYFSTTGVAICHENDVWDEQLGHRLAVTRMQAQAHHVAFMFIHNLMMHILHETNIENACEVSLNNHEVSYNCYRHVYHLSNNLV